MTYRFVILLRFAVALGGADESADHLAASGVAEFMVACQAREGERFDAAERPFEAEAKVAPGPLDPRWGYASCLTFIGRTYEPLDQRQEAAEYYREVFARQPCDHLAGEGLARVTAKN